MADLPEVVKNLVRILSLEQLRHIRILQGAGPGDGGHPARYPFRGKCARGSGTKSASGNSAIAARVSSRLAECVSCWRPRKCYILASEGKGGMCYIIASASWSVASSESGKLGVLSEINWMHLKLTEKTKQRKNESLWRMGTVQYRYAEVLHIHDTVHISERMLVQYGTLQRYKEPSWFSPIAVLRQEIM